MHHSIHRPGLRRLLAVAVAGAFLATSCGDGGDDDSSSDTTTTAVEAAPEQTGVLGELPELPVPEDEVDTEATLKLAWTTVPVTLDPHQGGDDSLYPLIYDRLFQLDQDRNLVPALATDFEISDDKLAVTITLREDATFPDGTPVDAEAVKASLERGIELETSVVAGQLAPIESVEAVDATTVELSLKHPAASLLYALADPVSSVINPAALAGEADLTTTIAGSTPWRLESFEPGQSLVLEKDPEATYWDPAAFTYDRIEVVVGPDPSTTVTGLQTGEFQVARFFGDVEDAQETLGEDFVIDGLQNFGGPAVWLNANVEGPFTDRDVRAALLAAVDREGIAGTAVPNCVPSTQIAFEGELAYDEDLEPSFPYDLDAAGEGLSGVTEQVDALVPASLPQETAIATVLQQVLNGVGMDVELDTRPAQEVIPLIQDTPMTVIQNSSRNDFVLTAQNMYLRVFNAAPEADRAELEELIAEADALDLGSDEREDALEAINRFVTELGTVSIVCNPTGFWISAPNVIGVADMSRTQAGKFDARYWVVTR